MFPAASKPGQWRVLERPWAQQTSIRTLELGYPEPRRGTAFTGLTSLSKTELESDKWDGLDPSMGSRMKSVKWYDAPLSVISPEPTNLLEKYSNIPRNEVIQHIMYFIR